MNIYLLDQEDNRGYDTYDSCIVYAESEELAQCIHPNRYAVFSWDSSWARSPENVTVTYLGQAADVTVAGVILASFNAG